MMAMATKFVTHGDPITIRLPAKVAFSLDALQKVLPGLAERLGCPQCFSGRDCRFRLERQFLVDDQLAIHVGASDPDGDPVHSGDTFLTNTATRVSVRLAGEVSSDLGALTRSIAEIVDKLGHPQCFSGFDISFREQVERIMLVDRAGKATLVA
jgi:hypothetical protein